MTAYPFIVNEPYEVADFLWDGECRRCREPIGNCWVGDNDGRDEYEWISYWVHERFSLCRDCHETETAPIRERVVLPAEGWQPEVGGWMLVHARATDCVYFGPFATLLEVEEWMRDVGRHRGVSATLIPLVSPTSSPENLWQDPIRDHQIVYKDSLDTEG